MGKRIIQILGGLLILLMMAGALLYFTDNRYSLSVKSYFALKNASSMDLSFESRMGMGENSMGITGETEILTNPRVSFTKVSVDLPILGNMNIVDIYSSEDQVYHKYNLSFLPWQEGMPILQEDAFNPAMFGEQDMNINLLDLLKLATVLDKGTSGELLEYYTTDFFTEEEFKDMLVRILKLDEVQVRDWSITEYKIAFAFNAEKKELEKVSVTFDHQITEVVLSNVFELTIHELDTISEIAVPEGLQNFMP